MSEAPIDLLLLAAHPVEFTGLAGRLGPELSAEVRGLRVAARPVGVGVAAAAAGTATALARIQPRAAFLLGSFGHYPGGLVGGALQARAVVSAALLDDALMAGQAELPGLMPQSLSLDPELTAALVACCAAPPIAIANTLGITTDQGLSQRLGGEGRFDGENLEAYAVALACAEASVPLAALLVSTNSVGPAGRRQWLDNHAAAAERGSGVLLAWLDSGATGMPRHRRSG